MLLWLVFISSSSSSKTCAWQRLWLRMQLAMLLQQLKCCRRNPALFTLRSSLLFSYSLSDSFNFNAFYISARRSLALVRAVTTVMRSLALPLACVRGVHLLNVYVPACLHVCAYLCVFVCSDCVLCDCLTACWLLLWRWPVYL